MHGAANEREGVLQSDQAMSQGDKGVLQSNQNMSQGDKGMPGGRLFLGEKMKAVFVLSLIMLIASTLNLGMEWLDSRYLPWGPKSIRNFLILWAGMNVIFAIAHGVILIAMGTCYKAFTLSGVLMIASSFLSVWEGINEKKGLALLILLAVSVAKFFQMKCYVKGCRSSLHGVEGSLAAGWRIYWELYAIILVTSIVSAFCIFIPGFYVLEVFVKLSLALSSIGVGIMMIILTRQSSDALIRHAVMQEDKGGMAS